MMDINKNHLGVEKAFVKSWDGFDELDTGHFMFYECEFVDSIASDFGLHGGGYAMSIDMQNSTMTIYDRVMDVFAKFDIDVSLGFVWETVGNWRDKELKS